ncbi:virB8 family protein [uncultured Campylobacter sp.]|uniref:virB8 family protein n=1 Tax=uncultured Campylobacter sp. TaxID=218934 RepID=UPI0026142755|nr:type IV secretion system protein [uncultured Campylobacter sp.]
MKNPKIENNDEASAISYEASIRYLVEKSNRRAWTVAFIFAAIAIIAVVAVIMLTPLKTVEPYVIRVDNAGMVDIITTVKTEDLTQNEALDKYFISQYVKAREGYYYNILNQDYLLVQMLSTPEIAELYRKIYEGKSARQEALKNDNEVSIDIKSVVLGESAGAKTATIRFDATTRKTGAQPQILGTAAKIVTLSYDYYPDNPQSEEERLKNPLGFKVTAYRIDDEIIR